MVLNIDARATAFVMIDLQQGIMSRQLDPYDAKTVVANSVSIAKALVAAGGFVVPVHVDFSKDDGDRLKQPVDAPTPMPPGGMPVGWAELAPEIAALHAPIVITKRNWSAFHGTELDLQLRRRGITTMILGGVATNFGVESTARDAWQHGYELIIAQDASSSLGDGMHKFAIDKILPRLGVIRSTSEIIAALS